MTGARFFSPVRFMTLLMKEFRQMICDPATIFLGTILPVILILLFGWGLSMDLTKVPAAVVEGESTPLARAVTQEFVGSRYFDITTLKSRTEAETLLSARRIERRRRDRPHDPRGRRQRRNDHPHLRQSRDRAPSGEDCAPRGRRRHDGRERRERPGRRHDAFTLLVQ